MSEENESKWTFDEFKTKILTPSPLEARMTAITETAQVGIRGVDHPNSTILMRPKRWHFLSVCHYLEDLQ